MTENNPYQAPESDISNDLIASSSRLENLASGQKLVIYAVLIYFIGIAGQVLLGPIAILFLLAALIMSLIGLFKVLKARQSHIMVKILLALLLLIPLINLITMLRINATATKTLRQAGYTVGLMGAKKAG